MFKATKLLKKSSQSFYKTKLEMKSNEKNEPENERELVAATTVEVNNSEPLKQFSLKGNQLSGSILIGNYTYLTQLEVSENEMEVLDLSSLAQLETLKCSHNKLTELMINGNNLVSLQADSNCLQQISASPVPQKLCQVNISNNYFTELPKWLNECERLENLNASHNQLQKITDFILTSKTSALKSLNLSYNRLRIIERLSGRFVTLQSLQLQSNELQLLTDNLFSITYKCLKELNISCNKLQVLPPSSVETATNDENAVMVLEDLRISNNSLDDRIFATLFRAKRLKVLHVAYNKISTIPADFLDTCSCLEELILSGNLLQQLPDEISKLKYLEVLRLHSNLLLSIPSLNQISMLKVLDLAHNHLNHLDLLSVLPRNLKYLDLSCNFQLQVDEQQVKICRNQRKWSLIDVTGKNRSNLPINGQTEQREYNSAQKPPWLIGFSETPGKCRKLLVAQLREMKFRTDEALLGMFAIDVSASGSATKMAHIIPKLFQQERSIKDNIGQYMKYTLLALQKKLNNQSIADAILCHIARENARGKDFVRSHKTKRYMLRVASIGEISAYLIRRTTNFQLINQAQEGCILSSTKTLPDPTVTECILNNDDEYLVIGNANLWSVMDVDRVAREIRKEENVILAAKRMQDIAQSFGVKGNLSIIVVRFKNIGTDVDFLIKELKQIVRKKPQPLNLSNSTSGFPNVCKRTCCDRSLTCRHRFSAIRPLVGFGARSDRSSPSGQSDPPLSVVNQKLENDGEYILAHARVLEETTEMEMLDETDSALSEEQFKCWEYMLEQNTQLLFDKELNTISKTFTKNRNAIDRKINKTPERFDLKSSLLKSNNQKFISTSSPQLLHTEAKKPYGTSSYAFQTNNVHNYHQPSFLSKHFGSSRSFGAGYNLFSDAKSRDSLGGGGGLSKFSGGPNAAYFGSLQRLMPYNLEYDFNLTRERSVHDEGDDDDFNEQENRIRKYWGVATTEL
uniref:PPM-type phosphatase domain-containing protein n=1 Tax=Glossina palpalis gambiensis TaxID=67801 RepID=A0A1B0BJG8_9MUSC